jgi:hypothetical protein
LSSNATNPPTTISSSLTANGVALHLVGNNGIVGITFQSLTAYSGTYSTSQLSGCVFSYDRAYQVNINNFMALIGSNQIYTLFFPQTAYNITPLTAVSGSTNQISTPATRRKRTLGYI